MTAKRIAAAALCVFASLQAAHATELKVLSSVALKPVLEAISADFEKSTGHTFTVAWAESGANAAAIDKGVAFDVAIITPNFVDGLAAKGKLERATVTPVARSGLGIAIRKGTPKPDVRTVDAFKRTLLNAKTIGVAGHSASGRYLDELLARLKLAEAVKSKITPLPGAVYSYMARGDAEIALTQIAAVLPFDGIELAGPLPPAIQHYTVFVGTVSTASQNAAASRALLTRLTSPGTAAILRKTGLETPAR